MADALEPRGFGGETCCWMEVPDCALDAGELVHILDGLLGCGARGGEGKLEVSEYRLGGRNDLR